MFDTNFMLLDSTTNVNLAASVVAAGSSFARRWHKDEPQVFCLYVPKAVGSSPTLDFVIQGSRDAGSSWETIYTWPQVTAAGRYYARIITDCDLIRQGAITITGTNADFGKVRLGLVPAGSYDEP